MTVQRGVQLFKRLIWYRGTEMQRRDNFGPEIVRLGKNTEASGKSYAASKTDPVQKAENKRQDFCEEVLAHIYAGGEGGASRSPPLGSEVM